jgi:hypothetical protein
MHASVGLLIHSFTQARIARISAWSSVACTPNEKNILFLGLNPYTPASDRPAILNLSVNKDNPVDGTPIRQVDIPYSRDRISTLNEIPKAITGIILS